MEELNNSKTISMFFDLLSNNKPIIKSHSIFNSVSHLYKNWKEFKLDDILNKNRLLSDAIETVSITVNGSIYTNNYLIITILSQLYTKIVY